MAALSDVAAVRAQHDDASCRIAEMRYGLKRARAAGVVAVEEGVVRPLRRGRYESAAR